MTAVIGPPHGLRFDRPIPAGGYRWWRLDAWSPDGRHGITLVAHLGHVFSPHYARAWRRGAADPLDHSAMHVALHGEGGGHSAMTERASGAVLRWKQALAIGPSAMLWDGQALGFGIDEITAPWRRHLRGTVRVQPGAVVDHTVMLDAAGRHRWSPLAPSARVEVELVQPALRWGGVGFLDTQEGEEPLEQAFTGWSRSHARLRGGTAILCDVQRRDGTELTVALLVGGDGRAVPLEPPPRAALPPTRWRLGRGTRADAGCAPRVLRTLTDSPFRACSVLRTRLLGETVTALHESLSLERFRAPWVQALLALQARRAWR